MIQFNIRPVQFDDAHPLYAIRHMEGVRENLLATPASRISDTEEYINSLTSNDHVIVAEMVTKKGEPLVIGSASLHLETSLRLRHCAEMGIMVHTEYQNKGVGKKLTESLLDIADKWLKLIRIELNVFKDNTPAVKLYESFGFVIEGTRKFAAIKNGKYSDLLLMARYKQH